MPWIQQYAPVGGVVTSACLAAIPLIILFYMLAVRKAKGHIAAVAGLAGALIVAVAVWGMPVSLAISSTLNGAAFGLFPIVWIVITAVWVYNMTVESGEFEIIKDSLARLTDDRRLQALFIAYAFSCFIEGTAGFGTPVAIAAAMLVGLGFTPLWGAGIALIANTAPVAFGAIGVPLIVAASVSGLDQMTVSAIAGRQLPILALIVPLWVCVTMCGFKRSLEVLPAIIVGGVCFAGAQFLLARPCPTSARPSPPLWALCCCSRSGSLRARSGSRVSLNPTSAAQAIRLRSCSGRGDPISCWRYSCSSGACRSSRIS